MSNRIAGHRGFFGARLVSAAGVPLPSRCREFCIVISGDRRRPGAKLAEIGRAPLDVDRQAVLRDRGRGLSLTDIAQAHRISRASVSRIIKEAA